jgi:hypothetical protein
MKTNKIVSGTKILFFGLFFIFSQNIFSQITKDSVSIVIPNTLKIVKPVVAPIVVSDSIKPVKKLNFGCGVGVNFVGGTNLSLSPNATYKVCKSISLGGGLQASYSALKNIQNTTSFGLNLLGNYNPIKQITTVLEFAQINSKINNETGPSKVTKSFWESVLFVGAGLNITPKIALGAKYNMLYKEDKSVYTSAIVPFVNIGF